ncbi:MAG: hypothetical protein H0X12_02625 [Nocardioides sp.]|nr:hypothetical protein [Nocardioides sp.]
MSDWLMFCIEWLAPDASSSMRSRIGRVPRSHEKLLLDSGTYAQRIRGGLTTGDLVSAA